MTSRLNGRRITIHVALITAALISATPFAWLVCGSFKSGDDLFRYAFLPPDLGRLTTSNFRSLFANQDFGRWLTNSAFLASTQTVLLVLLSSIGGFALAKYRFRGKRLLMFIMLLTILLPAQMLIPSMYELMWRFGWLNSYAAILVPGMVSVVGMFLFRQAMLGLPDELLHAARVDGCSEIRLWWT
ncbi:MAG: carbohydrate ABC transporter permease, partial [Tepidisphaeraceae bacterium]